MRKFALVLTYLFIGSIPFFMVRADLIFGLVESLTVSVLLAIAVLRVGYGIALFGAADSSRMPRFLKFLGVLFIAAGVITPFIGIENIRALFGDIYSDDVWVLRSGAVFPAIMFGFIAYALAPRQDDANDAKQVNASQATGEVQ